MNRDETRTKAQLIAELVELRKQNAKSEDRYRSYVENAPDSIFVVNSAGRYIDVNAAACKMTGYSREELLTLSIPELVAPDSPPESPTSFATLQKRGKLHTEIALLRKDGSSVLVSLDAVALPGNRFMAFCADITERKEVEKQLHRQAAIVAGSTDIMALLDKDFTYLFTNEAHATPFGKTVDEIVGHTVPEVFGEEFFNAVIKPSAERCLAGEHAHFQEWIEFPVTGRKHMDITFFPYVGPTNEVLGIVVNARDTTARKLAEDELRESEDLLTSFKNNIPGVVSIRDVQGRIVEANKGLLDLLGLQMEDVVGKTVYDLYPQDAAEGIFTHHQQVLCGIGPSTIEVTLLLADDVPRSYLTTRFPVRNAASETVAVAGIAIEITDRKRAEQQRIELERQVQHSIKLESLGVLAGGIAHDFNNLLMGVLGNADLALADLSPEAPSRASIERIQAAARSAAKLADQMLAYSGRGQFVVVPINLSEAVQEMGHLLAASVSKTTILDYQLEKSIPPIEADLTQIRQVVINLITNASEALQDQSGTVKLATGVLECDGSHTDDSLVAGELSKGTYSYLEVSDAGVGMDADAISKMFDPFFTTKFTGRGLGLAAVFGIVRGHKGAIKVDSKPGKGTTIRVLFPVTDKPAESPPGSGEEETAPTVGGTILLVDDEPIVLEVGKRMLEMASYEVKTARDGVEAIELFKDHSKDIGCVILDLTMPRMNGVETLVELQKIRSDVPVLLTSGYSFEEVEASMSTKGFAGFLKKPYRMNELKESIAKLLSA